MKSLLPLGTLAAALLLGCSGPAPRPALPRVVELPRTAPADASAPSAPAPVDLALGYSHTCARFHDGALRCFGVNDSRRLGDGSTDGPLVPGPPLDLSPPFVLAASAMVTCALREAGSPACWGGLGQGPLGDRPAAGYFAASDIAGRRALQMVFGYPDVCLLLDDHEVVCAPAGAAGDAPRGGAVARVDELRGAQEIAARRDSVCARMQDGGVACVARGEGAGKKAPARIKGLRGASSLSMRDGHACAVDDGGATLCWGDNAFGQLGDGTTDFRAAPTPVSGLGRARAVAVGDLHSCALLEDGEVRCWGANYHGQLGSGRRSLREIAPVAVAGVTQASLLVAGSGHTCARLGNDSLRCWGRNEQGQLGDGTRQNRRTAVRPALDAPRSPPRPGEAASCARGGRLRIDLEAWRRSLGAAQDEDERDELLGLLDLGPVPSDNEATIDEACSHSMSFENIVSASHKTIRVDRRSGYCLGRRGGSGFSTVLYEVAGGRLSSIFEAETYRSSYSVDEGMEIREAAMSFSGGFPKQIELRERTRCEAMNDEGGVPPDCKPKSGRRGFRWADGGYREQARGR